MTARLYDAAGANLWPGGAPLADPELLALPLASLICDAAQQNAEAIGVDLVLIVGDDGALPDAALAHVVSALDGGGAVAVHGADDAAVAVASAAICRLLGGAHA